MAQPSMETIVKQTVKKILDGTPVHKSWDGSFASNLADALKAAGYVNDVSYSACSKASAEYHLKPGKKSPKTGLRVEIISASFLGAFTQVSTHED